MPINIKGESSGHLTFLLPGLNSTNTSSVSLDSRSVLCIAPISFTTTHVKMQKSLAIVVARIVGQGNLLRIRC